MNIKKVTSSTEQKQAFHVRSIVFIEEQQVPKEIEIDEYDDEAIHFVGYKNGRPIAASRLRWVNDFGKLERICVLKEFRGKSYGTKIITEMEKVISTKGYMKSTLNAQTHAQQFYERLGYETVSKEFMDAGIPHVTMEKQLNK